MKAMAMAKYSINDFKGVIPALVTAFDLDGRFNEELMRGLTTSLLHRGVDGFYLTGSTGEGFMMSAEERMRVVEIVCEVVAGRVPVMVHVGAISTYQTVSLAEHAEAAGADAISSVPPIYWPFSPAQVANYYTDVTASTSLPMVVYKIALAGEIGFELLTRLAAVPGIEGVKYTAPTHFEIARIKREIGPDFRVFSGADEMAMSGLAFGADGLIGSFYNIIPELYAKLVEAMDAGNLTEAKVLQERANAIIFFTLKQYPMSAVKRIMAWQGADAGYCRKPFDNYETREQEAALKAAYRAFRDENNLGEIGFLTDL
ncbi:dihydrodipicolinate synthase family protein [Flavimaricola marinus]|uniref:N-acetylneuraminate lyase n=1 Tax=Flavimaricola marinus TaxID=1819565 RepID=A0A238LHL5_9RHOB|nr:dihydrodipicolinate synthase family protein [Flavimaricola marinus]SMY08894.1 N-acetylneuraminate lyase [Flavimaricola marinus]